MPATSMDYMFLGTKNINAKHTMCWQSMATVQVQLNASSLRSRGNKGPVDWVVKDIERFIRDQGCSKNGSAIQKMHRGVHCGNRGSGHVSQRSAKHAT